MTDCVYAVHDFAPQNDDELPFLAGDCIEVIERDDQYDDGWWQGRNLFGRVGLFPVNFVTDDPTLVQAQVARTSIENGRPESGAPSGDGVEVMKATMTDVQQAIEQLGHSDRDEGSSLSFASTRDGDTTTSEHTDRETDTEANGETWHKGARSNLAEKARRQQQQFLEQEQAAFEERMKQHAPILETHLLAPPIDFEMSDESEEEGAEDAGPDTLLHHLGHEHEEEERDEDQRSNAPDRYVNMPKEDENQLESAWFDSTHASNSPLEEYDISSPTTARQPHFPNKIQATDSNATAKEPLQESKANIHSRAEPLPQSLKQLLPAPPLTPTSPTSFAVAAIMETVRPISPPNQAPNAAEIRAPSPHSILPSPPSSQGGSSEGQHPKSNVSPSEWTVEDVVEWAKSKGFDSSVTDKFIEHEITGDVLLDLDANVLKAELEIHAFGKRSRIMKEIAELRRPPSIASMQRSSSQITHNRTISQSVSLPNSVQYSMHSPQSGTMTSTTSPHLSDNANGQTPASVQNVANAIANFDIECASTLDGASLGLAISQPFGPQDVWKGKNRPAQLNLSSSDTSLSARAKSFGARFSPKSVDGSFMKDDQIVISDVDSAHGLENRNLRRRLFGLSGGSGHSDLKDSASQVSKDMKGPASPNSLQSSLSSSPVKRGSTDDSGIMLARRRKRSAESTRAADRLSLFGASLPLPRSRKPAPRVFSFVAEETTPPEKHTRGFSRLYFNATGRKSSGKLSQSNEEDGSKASEEKDSFGPSMLRKRSSSNPDRLGAIPGIGNAKSGDSVLELIGDPDHNGWMQKKGEHYGVWKLRYFVLKGPHLYYLRSNNKSETKIKGYINTVGYKVISDENVNPGKYGFRLIHDVEKTHYFCANDAITVRDWMKALMKATIHRDYSKPVVSSCNIPTIPLAVAQSMNPAPRPPSPEAREATQKAHRHGDPNQLSPRDARVIMGLPSAANGSNSDKTATNGALADGLPEISQQVPFAPSLMSIGSDVTEKMPPTRPSREMRRTSLPRSDGPNMPTDLILWANGYLPQRLQVPEQGGKIYNGLALFRLAEAVRGRPSEPAVHDSAFPTGPNDDRLEGLFKLFDFFVYNEIRMGNVSINDVRQGKVEKIVQMLEALRAWEEKRRGVERNTSSGSRGHGLGSGSVGVAAAASHAHAHQHRYQFSVSNIKA